MLPELVRTPKAISFAFELLHSSTEFLDFISNFINSFRVNYCGAFNTVIDKSNNLYSKSVQIIQSQFQRKTALN